MSKELQNSYGSALDETFMVQLASEIRAGVFQTCIQAGSGHIGGSSSSVELMTVLYFGGVLRYDPQNPNHPDRDRVLVRGHLGPLRYKIFSLIGWVDEPELSTYRRLGSRLQGHEDHLVMPGVDITPSGSLGMLLSYGVGCALAGSRSKRSFRTFVFLGDGEEQEGNVAEAARHAAHLGLSNLTVILDQNRKQLSDPTNETDSANIAQVWEGYGWRVVHVGNGHNVLEIAAAYEAALANKTPTIIIAHTVKGLGLDGAESHFSGYHTINTCPSGIPEAGVAKLNRLAGEAKNIRLSGKLIGNTSGTVCNFLPFEVAIAPTDKTTKDLDFAQVEYFSRLKQLLHGLEKRPLVFFLTADVTKQDDVELLKIREFSHYFNVGLREQHMIGMAHGISITHPNARVIVNCFDAFTLRSLDQLAALADGKGSAVIISDIAGLTNCRNGKTHQVSTHMGALLQMANVVLLEAGDGRDLFNCLNWAIGTSRGVVFIRTHSSSVEPFPRQVDDRKNLRYYCVYRPHKPPDATIVASGFAVGKSIEAAKLLEPQNKHIQVLNVVNHKALDYGFTELLAPGKPVVTVYNGNPEFLQASVAKAIMEYAPSAVSRIIGHGFSQGTSGSLEELVKHFKLDGEGIAQIVSERILGS